MLKSFNKKRCRKTSFFIKNNLFINIFVILKKYTSMRKILVTTSLFYSLFSQAQVGGEHIYQFLNLPMSPRLNALGGNNVTTFDHDTNQVLYNPPSLNDEMDGILSVNYGNFYGDVNLGSATYAKTLKNGRNIHVGVTYLNYGSIDGYDEFGQETGAFTGSDIALSVGYSHRFQDTDFYLGSNIKFISSSLEAYNSLGMAADIGGMYVNPDSGWTAGVSVRNIGTQLTTYQGENENLPLSVTAGVSKQLENVPIRWHFTLENLQKWEVAFSNPNRSQEGLDGTSTEEEIGFLDNALRHIIIGADVFTNKKFNIRFAYNFRRGEEMKILEQKSFAGFSAGFGLKLNRIHFEYSHSRFTLAGNTNVLGLSIKL